MPKTDDTRVFNGKRYRYLTWVSKKSAVDWFKRRAKENGALLRVTRPKSTYGLPYGPGYVLWVRGRMPKTYARA